MKIKDVTFSVKQGLPNYGSVQAGITMEFEEGTDNIKEVFEKARQIVLNECTTDPDWIKSKQPNEVKEVKDDAEVEKRS